MVEATEGDVYVGRYDCLRVASGEDQVIRTNDIVSIICESYTNPDGRYDVNRFNADTRNVNFNNYNLRNEVYDQTNNYFNYNRTDYRVIEEKSTFPTQFTWSLAKLPNSLTDQWTDITGASTYALLGECGSLSRIVNFNNQLYAFQKNGVSNILFNNRVQIPTSDGMPIEISNNYDVNGVRYLSTSQGLQNKFAYTSTNRAMYFIDDHLKTLNIFDGQSITDLSISKGMSSWIKRNTGDPSNATYTGILSNYKLSTDYINSNVYIHNDKDCLAYSELLGAFTSFYDYQNTLTKFNVDTELLAIKSTNNTTQLYKQHSGNKYNTFFGEPAKESYIHYLVNPNPTMDKVFNNIEFRGDLFNSINNKLLLTTPWNKIQVWNEYQDSGAVDLVQYKNLQKKFRV